MPKPEKPGRATPSRPLNDPPEAAFDPAEASENSVRRLSGDPPALRTWVGEGLQSTTPGAPGLSGRKRRPSADPGNGAEASDRDGSGSDPAGGPSSAPPKFAGAVAAGTPVTLGDIASFSRAAQASGPRNASAPVAQRDPVAALSASARARLGWRRRRLRPGRRWRAIRPGGEPSRRRLGRCLWPKSGRRGA